MEAETDDVDVGEEVGVIDRVGIVDGDSVEVVEAVVVPLGENEAFVELVGERVGLVLTVTEIDPVGLLD